MKKILSIALVLAMMVSSAALVACGDDSESSTGSTAGSTAPSGAGTTTAATTAAPNPDEPGTTTADTGSEGTEPKTTENQGDNTAAPTEGGDPTQGGDPSEGSIYHEYQEVDNLDAWKSDKVNLTEMFYDSMVETHSIFDGFSYLDSEGIEEAGTHELASNLFDGDPGTKWCCGSDKVSFCSAIVWVMDQEVNVTGYTMTTANDNTKYTDRNPITWRLYGAKELPEPRMDDEDPNTGWEYFDSETVPAGWTLIDAVDSAYPDDQYSSQLPDLDKFEVGMDVANPGSYKYFMLLIDYCEGGTFQLGDFTLYGTN